jgi:phosphate-selective porin OprO/OprP
VYDASGDGLRLIHVGGAFSTRSPANGVVQYKSDPQSSLLVVSDNPPSPFLPGVDIPSNSQQLYNLQAAAVDGPLSLQAEWSATGITRLGGGVVFLHGAYAAVGYFLTGEHRGYDGKRGAFDRVKVREPLLRSDGAITGTGAVELVGRFTVADYSANRVVTADGSWVAGTVLFETTIGANWHLNDYVRLMANYTLALQTRLGAPTPVVHTFGLRAAVDW